MRCFLAVPLADPGLAAAQRLQDSLRNRIPDVRWARPETLHVTVHFFGELDASRVSAALEAVSPIARRTATFDLDLERLGAFPLRGTPRVLWLGPARDSAALTTFATTCATALRDADFDVDSRPYRPHCTLGRPRAAWSDAARIAWAASVAEPRKPIRCTGSRLVLYESRSATGGAVYTEHSVLQLGSA